MIWKLKVVAGGLAAVLILLLAAKFGFGYVSGAWSCKNSWKESGLDYKYKASAGCMVKTSTGWIPAKNYRFD